MHMHVCLFTGYRLAVSGVEVVDMVRYARVVDWVRGLLLPSDAAHKSLLTILFRVLCLCSLLSAAVDLQPGPIPSVRTD